MEDIKELIGKIQLLADKPIDTFIEYLENGSAKLREYISLVRDLSLKLKHLKEVELKALEDSQTRRIDEDKKSNSQRATYSRELTKLKAEIEEQDRVKTKNTQHIGALESQIDGLTQLYDKKKAEYDMLVDKIDLIKNPPPLTALFGNAHEERYRPKQNG